MLIDIRGLFQTYMLYRGNCAWLFGILGCVGVLALLHHVYSIFLGVKELICILQTFKILPVFIVITASIAAGREFA